MLRQAFNSAAVQKKLHPHLRQQPLLHVLNKKSLLSAACNQMPKFSTISQQTNLFIDSRLGKGETGQRRFYHSTNSMPSPTRACINTSTSTKVFVRYRIPVASLPSYNLISAHLRTNKLHNDMRRMMSNEAKPENKPDETPSGASDDIGKGKINTKLLGVVGLTTLAAAYIISPDAMDHMKSSTRQYNELDPEDDIYLQMKEVSNEVRGEITRKILGKELSEMVEAENKAAGNTADVVADVLNSDALQNAIASLITRVVGSAQFQVACQTLIKNLWADLVNDPETMAQIVALLNTAIKDEKIKKSFKELVLKLLQDEDVYNELTGLVVRLGEDKNVLDATKELLTESAHQALNDPEILDHSMEFATDIVGDNVIQRTSGEALRNTVTYAVRPSLSTFLSVFGVALLFISASALGQARMAAWEGKEIDAATSLVAQNIGASIWRRIVELGTMPADKVAAMCAAIANVALAPIGVVGKWAFSMSKAGGTALNFAHTFISKIISSPGMALEILRNSLIALQFSSIHYISSTLSYMSSLPEAILGKTREGLVFLASSAGATAASVGSMLYLTAASHLAEIFKCLRTAFDSGTARSVTSFDIILKNVASQGKWQVWRFRDASGIWLASIASTVSGLFGRRPRSDVV